MNRRERRLHAKRTKKRAKKEAKLAKSKSGLCWLISLVDWQPPGLKPFREFQPLNPPDPFYNEEDGCVVCGSLVNLQNHHIVPVSWQGGNRKKLKNKETISLCHHHHLYMSPYVRKIGYYGYNTYSLKEANHICDILNRKTKYFFKVHKFTEHYKTVPPKDFVTILYEAKRIRAEAVWFRATIPSDLTLFNLQPIG